MNIEGILLAAGICLLALLVGGVLLIWWADRKKPGPPPIVDVQAERKARENRDSADAQFDEIKKNIATGDRERIKKEIQAAKARDAARKKP